MEIEQIWKTENWTTYRITLPDVFIECSDKKGSEKAKTKLQKIIDYAETNNFKTYKQFEHSFKMKMIYSCISTTPIPLNYFSNPLARF